MTAVVRRKCEGGCGRWLSDPVSVARGLGDVCDRRLNGRPPAIRTPAAEPGPMPGQDELPLIETPALWSL